MKNNLKLVFSSCVLAGLLTACDVLDTKPVDSITQDNFWNTPDEATAAAVGLNDGMQDATQYVGVWGDLRADIFSSKRGNLVQSLVDVMLNNISPGSEYSSWTRLYTVVGRANWMLANLPRVSGLSQKLQDQYTGEAAFARAFCYYYAVRLWGDVPLITQPYTSATADFLQPRNPKAEVLAQIEKDIDLAISKLPDTYSTLTDTKGRATRWAALALKTDFSLWMAKVEGKTDYYPKALATADQIIKSGMFRLVTGAAYADLFAVKNQSESIYEIQFNNSQNELQEVNSPASLTSYGPFSATNRLLIHEKLLATFEPNDLRVPAITLDVTSSSPKYIKYRGSPTGVQQLTFFDANIIIYRLADIILLRAEMLNDQGQTAAALADLNLIRSRAGLPPSTATTQTQLKDAILKERYVELCAEGKRWFDLIRNGVVTREQPLITDPGNYLWPINEGLLNANSQLTQNPFYN
ncbi:RagB/SusD family nutrient uptake outer membrane protein [Persicitalea sp.]|uniref:RagB/SusD family nutrient uptake outer membrane protein n=1 Tax=Persicitalea sp. TaxID=3100273 RepID=UPI0035948066